MIEQYFYHPHSDNIVIGHAAFVSHEIEGVKEEATKLGINYSMNTLNVEFYKQVGWFIETPHGIAFMNSEFISNNMINLDEHTEVKE